MYIADNLLTKSSKHFRNISFYMFLLDKFLTLVSYHNKLVAQPLILFILSRNMIFIW